MAVVPLGINLDGLPAAHAPRRRRVSRRLFRADRAGEGFAGARRRVRVVQAADARRARAPRSRRVPVACARTVSRRRPADARSGGPRGRVHLPRRRRSHREARVSWLAGRALGAGDLRRAQRRVPARGDGERRARRAAAARRVHRGGREDRRRAARRARRSRGAGGRPAPPLARSRFEEDARRPRLRRRARPLRHRPLRRSDAAVYEGVTS